LIISETYVRFGDLGPEQSRRGLARDLFPITEDAARVFFNAFDAPRVGEVLIEDGSTKVRARIQSSAIALLALVGGYGTVRTGVEYARNDGRAAAAWMLNRVRPLLPIRPGEPITTRRRSPAATRLHRLFEGVQAGEMSADEATDRAEQILQEYGETTDTIAKVGGALQEEFRRIVPAHRVRTPRPRPLPRPEKYAAIRAGRQLRVFRDPRTGELTFSEQ